MKLYMTASSGNAYKPRLLLEMLKVPYEKAILDTEEQGAQAAAVSQDQSARPGAGARRRRARVLGFDRVPRLHRPQARRREVAARPIAAGMAEVMQWLALSNNELHYGLQWGRGVVNKIKNGNLEEYQGYGNNGLKVLEGRLKDHDWLALDRPTIADLACYPVHRGVARRRLQARGVSGGPGVGEARRSAAGLGEKTVTK